jgi:hypothetical protein
MLVMPVELGEMLAPSGAIGRPAILIGLMRRCTSSSGCGVHRR